MPPAHLSRVLFAPLLVLQGIGAGFIPGNLDTSLLDGTIKVRCC
jgi:cysteine synthase